MPGRCWASWQGRVGDSDLHGHLAAQAVFGAAVEACSAEGQALELQAGAVFIPPGALHRVRPAQQGLLVFIEPGCRMQAVLPPELQQRIEAGLSLCDPSDRGDALRRPDRAWPGWRAAWQCPAVGWDPDWLLAVRTLVDRMLPDGVVRLDRLAGPMGQSGERFRHVFAERMGLPVRRYVLWRRLRLAVQGLQQGAGVTEAAMEAGFADAAHFGRTLHRHFGLNARRLFS